MLATGPEPLAPIPTRATLWDALGDGRFDLAVIGGGITGAGIARDAVMRGLRVALVEKGDFAGGTSSRSSRLVHGGLRYLEHGHIGLVFEASRERRVLLRIAPHLVHPLAFTWPLYERARIGRATLEAGLLVYDALAMFRNVRAHRPLRAGGVVAREPALRRAGLRGGAVYFDAATDDARLTLATALDALRYGGVLLNYVTARAYVRDGDTVSGFVATDALTGGETRVHASVVVDATGPWRGLAPDGEGGFNSSGASSAQGTKGVHAAVPRDRVRNRDAITLLSPIDGRVMFVLPAGATTIIGTTDTVTTESPDEVRATRSDVRYLLDSVNAYLEETHLGEGDVIAAWAGIRPLAPGTFTGDPASASREHSIDVGSDGVVQIRGGKLTTYRAMAAEVVDRAQTMLGVERRAATTTDRAVLPGGDRAAALAAIEAENPALAEPVAPGEALSRAAIVHAVAAECACTVADVLIRRTHLAFERSDQAVSLADPTAELMGFTGDAKRRAVEQYVEEVERIFAIEP